MHESNPEWDHEDSRFDLRTTSTAIQLPNGNILFPYYLYDPRARRRGSEARHPAVMMIVSADNGGTWSKPIKIPNPFRQFDDGGYLVYTCGKIIRLSDGTLLLGIHGRNPDDEKVGTGAIRSVDNGKTWTDYTRVAADGK